MKPRIYSCILALCLLAVTTETLAKRPAAHPAAPAPSLPQTRIMEVNDEVVLKLEDGSEAVLAGLYYPQPLRARDWIKEHLGQQVPYRDLGPDRYGRKRLVALQPFLLDDGAALVFDRNKVDGLGDWLKHEDAARAKKLGVWSDPDLVLNDERTPNFIGQFHVVEGVVRHTFEARDATYLNFGDDWKKDFSVTIPKGAKRSFGDALSNLEGQKVRVRGIIYEENGPMITVTRPEQLEILSHGPSKK